MLTNEPYCKVLPITIWSYASFTFKVNPIRQFLLSMLTQRFLANTYKNTPNNIELNTQFQSIFYNKTSYTNRFILKKSTIFF